MTPPRLTRKLVLEAPERVADGAGGYATSWTALGTLWAEIRARTGREKAVEAVSLATMPYAIFVRAAPEGAPSRPKPEQRFRLGNRIFHIQAVGEADPEARYLVCYSREEVAQ